MKNEKIQVGFSVCELFANETNLYFFIFHFLFYNLSRQEAKQRAGSYGRTDNTCYVWTHSVHEEEVLAVVLKAEVIGYTRSHWYGTHASVTDERVNLAVFWQEQVHYLYKANAACRCDDKCTSTNNEDEYSTECEELGSLCRASHGETEEDDNGIVE